jgi:hypothetical protein
VWKLLAVVVTGALAGSGLVTSVASATSVSGGQSTRDVIVLLRNQDSAEPPAPQNLARRAQTLRGDQHRIIQTAQRGGSKRIRAYTTLNAVAMTATPTVIAELEADPSVATVVPDLPVPIPTTTTARPLAVPISPGASPTSTTPLISACPADSTSVSLEPEALQTMDVAYADGRPAAQNITTGAGVKVAYMAGDIDINNPDFMRNGQSIFVDYKDFSGSGLKPASGGSASFSEAFGDASAIAAQGNQIYDVGDFANPAHPVPGCHIRVKGVAPGVDLVGLKILSGDNGIPTSTIVQALDYAVSVDHVNVIDESIGSDPYPDQANDPISIADQLAIAAGVTIVTASGDAGPSNTIGSPASLAGLIAVGASTTFRTYAQTTQGTNLPGITSWADDNISGLSSSGFAQNGRLIDVVAPGDTGWSVCTPGYSGCVNDAGKPSPIMDFGGTSQSAPFTAGVAALVIASYQKSHPNDGLPSPALVKQIITSTATDLGHPAQLQGAGEVDALAAVRAAMTVPAEATGALPDDSQAANSLLLGSTQLDLNGAAGSQVGGVVQVRNLSASPVTISASADTLGDPSPVAAGTLKFRTAALPHFVFAYGDTRAYTAIRFNVPPDRARLTAAYAYQGGSTRIQSELVDPSGTLQAVSSTQGPSNYGHLDTRYPQAGTWTLYLFSILPLSTTVHYEVDTANFVPIGTTALAATTISPWESTTVDFQTQLSATPSDTAAAIHLHTSRNVELTIPVSLRTSVKVGDAPLSFAGQITGGDGRPDGPAQENTYFLEVPANQSNLTAAVRFERPDSAIGTYIGILVSPDGQALAAHSNINPTDHNGSYDGVQLSVRAPVQGQWRLVLETENPVAGNSVRQKFTAYMSTTPDTTISAGSLPQSTADVLAPGKHNVVHLRITNHSSLPQTYFTDARRSGSSWYSLAAQDPSVDLSAVSLNDQSLYVPWLVPSETDQAQFGATASSPLLIDAQYSGGDPEVLDGPSTTAVASVAAEHVAPGAWLSQAQLAGPFAAAAPAQTARYAADIHTRTFDTTFFSSTGDYWRNALIVGGEQASMPGLLKLAPGQSGNITVDIIPTIDERGDVITGTLMIDAVDTWFVSADEILAIPYQYEVS